MGAFMKMTIFILSGLLLGDSAMAKLPLDPFQKVRETFLEVYSPIVKKEANANLVITLDDDYPINLGSMNFENGNLSISLGSEYHLQPGVTPDSYAAIICHEIGHLLGGRPKKENLWSSTEAQSDYYSSAICMKKIFQHLPLVEEINVPLNVINDCAQVYTSTDERKICERSANAGMILMTNIYLLFKSFGDQTYHSEPRLDRKELSTISHHKLYPNVQCRLDTIVAGSLCAEKKDDDNDGFCDLKEGYSVGVRPSCWNTEGI